MLDTALALAKRNWFVFPIVPRGKTPAVPRGFLAATTDKDKIEAWWRRMPEANIGVATGKRSKILVLDVDGLDAEAGLRKLENQHAELPETVEAITPRPGRHIVFQYPDIPVRNSAGKLGEGLDIRGEGGYVVTPTSVHMSGRKYCWSVDSAPHIAAAPPWLIDLVADKPAANGSGKPCDWRAIAAATVGEGSRNDTITRLAGHLLARWVDPRFVLEMLQGWNLGCCQPPLDAGEVARIVASITRREAEKRDRP